MEPFITIGLEEWFSESPDFLTSVRCTQSDGIVRAAKLVESYINYFGYNDSSVEVKIN